MAAETCRCGHPRTVHEHLRDGSDCGPCGPRVCSRYRRDPGFWAVAAGRIRRHLALIRARR